MSLTVDDDALWTVNDVSRYLRIPVETLYQWRKKRIGPPAGKVGRHLRYEAEQVRQWFRNQEDRRLAGR